MIMRDTSVEAWDNVAAAKLPYRMQQVLELVCQHAGQDGVTRLELSEISGLRVNLVCSPVLRLIEAGLIRELPPRPCLVTGNNAHPLVPA